MVSITILTVVGLILIIIAWIVQLITLTGKKKTLNLFFVWLNLVGLLCMIVGNIDVQSNTVTILSIIMAVLIIITIILYPKKPKKTQEKEKD